MERKRNPETFSRFLASELFPFLFLCPLGLATTTAAILLYKSQILRLLNPRLLSMYWRGPSRGLRLLNPARPLYPRLQNPMLTVFYYAFIALNVKRNNNLLTYMGVFGLVQTRGFCLDGVIRPLHLCVPLLLLLKGDVITSRFFYMCLPLGVNVVQT